MIRDTGPPFCGHNIPIEFSFFMNIVYVSFLQIHPGVDYIIGTTSDEGGTMMMMGLNPEATEEENFKIVSTE